ncbi:putative glycosyltransferase 7 [Spinacia oleracea]|uniref:Glycosyltransferase 7 n=1 Tax=Spinacia oleracea TaxID=3562 RepID=A0A9R0HUU4_SPIOL|nr:putative glycosyltransferase 7 [Spinacia oleracea]
MVHPETPYETPLKSKITTFRHKTSSFLTDVVMFLGGALVAFLLVWSLWCFTTPPSSSTTFSPSLPSETRTQPDPTTFYDDPEMGYTLKTRVQNWDEKRKQWLDRNPGHPAFIGQNRVVMVTGSQPGPCKHPVGDHLLLRFFKNKVDYCRIHGYDIFYNNVLLDPKMFSFWAKYPVVKSAMLAHPEAEWIWWVDSDAALTDMDFSLPLERYKEHNLVIHGWPKLVFEKKSWTGLNAGVFLIRNCQWSMDLLEKWANFGPISPDYEKWGEIMKSVFSDKLYPESDDQTGIAYLMVKEGQKWKDKIYLEKEYYFEGYWVEIVDNLENITAHYSEIERKERGLRRKRAEKAGEDYRAQLEKNMESEKGNEITKRPFITHFTGCEPCSGKHNEMYSWESCFKGMNKALNFADNQVLKNFGYFHPDLDNSSWVNPISF